MENERKGQETGGSLAPLILRSSLGGVLMGLANLVPGISGGTMLLATGVYTRFIQGVAEITTFRFRLRSLVLLGAIGLSAAIVIALLAGPVKDLVTGHQWIMYSIFIGLTLGGVPLVWREARPATWPVYTGALVGFAVMAVMAILPPPGGEGESNYILLVIAGIAGASAMVLPGISGAYIFLVLGQYTVILKAVDQCKDGLRGDSGLFLEALHVVVPVGIGVLVGIVAISNLIRWTLKHHRAATLGVLLGLLFGAVLGIWPFQEAVERGEPKVYFTPTLLQAVAAVGLIAAGLGTTLLIDRLGRAAGEKPEQAG